MHQLQFRNSAGIQSVFNSCSKSKVVDIRYVHHHSGVFSQVVDSMESVAAKEVKADKKEPKVVVGTCVLALLRLCRAPSLSSRFVRHQLVSNELFKSRICCPSTLHEI